MSHYLHKMPIFSSGYLKNTEFIPVLWKSDRYLCKGDGKWNRILSSEILVEILTVQSFTTTKHRKMYWFDYRWVHKIHQNKH